ncbi:MAG: S-layer protein domain-containing protein [Methanosarcinaceae archaeon]|nr:hypothetical protein [Methanosarcinaceae archaeon]MDF1533653.1 S-layer protein domain-containing protein [Methanosarcinaceae archaeon]
MYNKTGTRILKTTVVVLVLILVSLICLSISASASEDNEVLVNGSGMYLTTGERWLFYQGYELVFKGLSSSQGGDKVWMELLLNSESVDDKIIREGEYFVYSRNSNEIFNITVDTIYAGSDGGLVTFKPVWQYLDPTLPEPDITQNPGLVEKLNGSLSNSNSSTGDKIENTAGFDAVLFFLCMSAAAIFKTNQKI